MKKVSSHTVLLQKITRGKELIVMLLEELALGFC
jgi:hypothetical protein